MLHLEDAKSSKNLERMPFQARGCAPEHERLSRNPLPGSCFSPDAERKERGDAIERAKPSCLLSGMRMAARLWRLRHVGTG